MCLASPQTIIDKGVSEHERMKASDPAPAINSYLKQKQMDPTPAGLGQFMTRTLPSIGAGKLKYGEDQANPLLIGGKAPTIGSTVAPTYADLTIGGLSKRGG